MAGMRLHPRRRARLLALLSLAAVACRAAIYAEGTRPSAEVREDGRPPAAAFFRSPLLSHVALSPDGAHIAALMARNGKEVVIVRATGGGEIRALTSVERTHSHSSWTIRQLGWGNDHQILIGLEVPLEDVGLPGGGRASRLMLVDLDGGHSQYLGQNWPDQQYTANQDRIVSWLPDDPQRVLITLWIPGERGAGAQTLNLTNGILDVVARPELGSTWWRADHHGQVRVGGGEPRGGGEEFLLARVDAHENFTEIERYDPVEEAGFQFAGFHPDPRLLYVSAPTATGRSGIYTYDLRTQTLGDLVFAHPEVDVGELLTSSVDGRLLAIGYATDRGHLHFVDEEAKQTWRALERALPDTENRYASFDRDEKLAVVVASSDTRPPRYFLFDREKGRLAPLFSAYPELEKVELAPMKSVTYRARDGVEIHGYLTLPLAGTAPWPTIVMPHGGPWTRDVWGWNPEVQFLVSRGFAVLQPNFRGSSGYGREFLARGFGSWGESMQEDITDGVLWLVDQGIADRDRIGIYGASYGGFAALEAMVRDPDVFRAGASLAGVTDLPALLGDAGRYWGLRGDWEKLIGHRWKDRDRLRAISPAYHADAIEGPVLIAHGTEDPIVPVSQANAMIDALERAGVEVEPLIYDGEVHGFIDERNAVDFHTRLAAFFERHLAPRSDPSGIERSGSRVPVRP